jgi:hypothetical protein
MTGDSETTALAAATKGNDAIHVVLTASVTKHIRTAQAIVTGANRHCSVAIISPARRLDRFLSGLVAGSLQLGMIATDGSSQSRRTSIENAPRMSFVSFVTSRTQQKLSP